MRMKAHGDLPFAAEASGKRIRPTAEVEPPHGRGKGVFAEGGRIQGEMDFLRDAELLLHSRPYRLLLGTGTEEDVIARMPKAQELV